VVAGETTDRDTHDATVRPAECCRRLGRASGWRSRRESRAPVNLVADVKASRSR
jgi:hypothetical protein